MRDRLRVAQTLTPSLLLLLPRFFLLHQRLALGQVRAQLFGEAGFAGLRAFGLGSFVVGHGEPSFQQWLLLFYHA